MYLRPFRVVQEFALEFAEVGREKLAQLLRTDWREVYAGIERELVTNDKAVEYQMWMERFTLRSLQAFQQQWHT